jgi:hypothetical protein
MRLKEAEDLLNRDSKKERNSYRPKMRQYEYNMNPSTVGNHHLLGSVSRLSY